MAAPHSRSASPRAEVRMPEKRILVVEDEAIVAMDINAILRRLGYVILDVLSTGEEAVRSVEEMRPDLVLMDIRLKGEIDGIEAARQIRERITVPIVFLTAHADVSTVERAKEVAPYGYLLKPFDERDLRRVIE